MFTMKFYNNCVNWPQDDVHCDGGLIEMCDVATEIKRKEFLENVDLDSLQTIETQLGYNEDFAMENDWHVQYFRSTHHNEPVYFFTWSAIEYVFKGEHYGN
jgi:hypothetical protein